MTTASISQHNSITLSAAIAAFVAAVAFTGVTIAEHGNSSPAPATNDRHWPGLPRLQHRASVAQRRSAGHALSRTAQTR